MQKETTMARRPRLGMMGIALMGTLLLGALGACGPSASASGGSGQKLLGIVSISVNDPNNQAVIKGATDEAKAKGWQVSVVDANGSADQANSAIENFVQRKATAIIDEVFPTTSLRAGLLAAQQANIPVATWGGGLGNGAVATDGDGGPFATPIVQKMVSDMGGHGAVLALTYHTGQVCREREQIFDQVLAQYPGIQVRKQEVHIPGYLQDGAQYATAWLAAHPAGSGKLAIWGCWDDPTLGAISALKQQNRTDVLTYGENGDPAAIAAVRAGTMTASEWENGPQEGKVLVDTLAQAIAAGSRWQPKSIDVPGVLVDAQSVGQFVQQHPSAVGTNG
jgi:ribose transport system substrate-binding protein